MSISAVEQSPNGPDVVHIADPGTDAVSELSPGVDTLDTITHVHGVGAGRDVRNRTDFNDLPPMQRRKGSIYTGTDAEPERWVHDEAVQVRQLAPTAWAPGALVLVTPLAVQVVAEKLERMKLILTNNDAAGTVYIGTGPMNATPTTGYALKPGASVTLDHTAAVWASTGAATCDLRWLESWRTDNTGN